MQREAAAALRASARAGLHQGRGSWDGEEGRRSELSGEKSVRLWECLEVMVEGGAVVAGDEKVPGLGDKSE